MTVFLQDPDVTLHHGDALTILRELPAESVHCVVTSPPFYGLRSYLDAGHVDKPLELGLEETPERWVERLVDVFREVRRVMRDDATLWLEVGDSFMPGKQLGGMPWRLAFALQADGWILRSDIVWARPNPMPESVTDRPTKSHSYVFLLTKSARYYWDAEAVREPPAPSVVERAAYAVGGTKWPEERNDGGRSQERRYSDYLAGRNIRSVWNITDEAGYTIAERAQLAYQDGNREVMAEALRDIHAMLETRSVRSVGTLGEQETLDPSLPPEKPRGPDGRRQTHVEGREGSIQHRSGERWPNETGPNMRSVWKIATQPYPEAHFATFPEALARRCILAGSPEDGVILDPFVGSGTVPYVARLHGRHSIGIDLNMEYLRLASQRLAQQSLFADATSPNKENEYLQAADRRTLGPDSGRVVRGPG